MIEIALDKNFDSDTFRNQSYPVYIVKSFSGTDIDDYRQLAKQIITGFANEQIIITRINTSLCSLNMLALALFIESCLIENRLDCVVFKVKNYEQAMTEYKPFVALTIGIRLALRLFQQPSKDIYRELQNMHYLGLDIRTDYQNKKIFLSLPGQETPHLLVTHTTNEALAAAATLKSLSLAQTGATVNAEINMNEKDTEVNIDETIRRIMYNVRPWIR